MHKINLNNYEAFVLDYYEGNLSISDELELVSFLQQHPQLNVDLTDTYLPKLEANEVKINFNNSLKKETEFFEEELILDYLEGNMSPDAKTSFEEKTKINLDLNKSVRLYQSTFLKPEPNLVYLNKNTLFKNEEQFILNNRFLNYLENELAPTEKKLFEEELISNKALVDEFASYQSVKLIADAQLVFETKQALKKDTKVIFLFRQRVAATLVAAMLLVVSSVYLFRTYFQTVPQKTDLTSMVSSIDSPDLNELAAKNPTAASGKIIIEPMPEIKKVKNNNSSLIHLNQRTLSDDSLLIVQNKNSDKELEQTKTNLATVDQTNKPNSELTVLNEQTKQEISNAIEAELTHYSSLDEIAESNDEIFDEPKVTKHRLWKRAVQLAQKANDLGLKALNGKEKENEDYLLSFNSFSIEKK